jgi:SAM-dependent methyltransferase
MSDRRVIDYFGPLLEERGPAFAQVGWGSEASQRRRFEVLIGIATPIAGKVLDVGCGLGDLYLYLKEDDFDGSYHGVDVHPGAVEAARARSPEARFDVLDISSLADPLPRYDYVVMSGAANIALDRYAETLEALIRRMYALADKGVAFNLLSNRADFVEPGEAYGDPGSILDFCLSLSRRVVLRHDYMPHDFTLYLYRDQ